MIRASKFLAIPAALALAAATQAADPPKIINGSQPPATSPPAAKPADTPKGPMPIIINYPSALLPADAKPANAPPAPQRVAYAYSAPVGYVDPVSYNNYGYGSMWNGMGGYGYDMAAPYTFGFGSYNGWASGSYGGLGDYGWGGYGIGALYAPAYLNIRPPLVDVLSTGVRANVGRLASFPRPAPVFGQVIGVYYR